MFSRSRLHNILAILAAALISTWPALFNRYPLLYADSLSYLGEGRSVAAQLLHRTGSFVGMRSELYSLGIYFWHWGASPWPVVAMNALLTAFILWLTVQALVPHRTKQKYLILVSILSVFTTMSWYVSLIMPDILGSLLYLSICLLVFAPESLHKFARVALFFIAWWALVSHATHLLLSAGILALLALLLVFRTPLMRSRGRALSQVAVVLAIAAATQLALHGYLYHRPTLDGNRLPYLSARFIADGPERTYLETHCGSEHWVLCAHLNHLPTTDDEFIWGDTTIWTLASPAEKQQILREERPLILRTIDAYPLRQLKISLGSFLDQLNDFGVNDFDNNTWMEDQIGETISGAHAKYERSLQAHNSVPSNFFTSLQRWFVNASIVVVFATTCWAWRKDPGFVDPQLLGFFVVIIPTLIANAFVTAVLSEVDSRFQARVIWLLPLLAVVMLMRIRATLPTA